MLRLLQNGLGVPLQPSFVGPLILACCSPTKPGHHPDGNIENVVNSVHYPPPMNYTMSKLKLLGIAVAGLIVMNIGLLAFLFLPKPPQPWQLTRSQGRLLVPRRRRSKIYHYERLHLIMNRWLHWPRELVQQHRTMISEKPTGRSGHKNKLCHASRK